MNRETTDFKFRAIDGTELLGYLAGLGLAKALQPHFPSLQIAWRLDGATFFPIVRVGEQVTREDIVRCLLVARTGWSEFGAEFPSAFRDAFATLAFEAKLYREFAVASLRDDPPYDKWSAFAGAESGRLSRRGDRRFIRSDYYFFSGQQTLTATAREIASSITEEELGQLFDTDPGGILLRDVMCLRFDPQEVEDHALRFRNPSSDQSSTNVPLNYLVLFALPLLTTLPAVGSVQTLGCTPLRKEKEIRWCLWTDFLTLPTALSIQRTQLHGDATRGFLFAARAVLAVRGQTYYRALPAVRLR